MTPRKRNKRPGDTRMVGRRGEAGSGLLPADANLKSRAVMVGLAMLGGAFVWAYWPTLLGLTRSWAHQPDYSHGYFVAPVAIYFLWARRAQAPTEVRPAVWLGLAVIAASIGIRYVAARYYVDAIDGWSLVMWCAGVALLVGGWGGLRWSWPSVAFLLFMIPLPWRAERLFSLPLQRIATKFSCEILLFFGQPAIAEGNTIWLHETRLEVEQACSGLRIFMGIAALAFVYLVLFPRPWWHRILLGLSVLPIALVANATRIVATGLVSRWTSDGTVPELAHDILGWCMIPFAASLFALVLWYLDRVVREVRVFSVGAILEEQRRVAHE